MKDFAEIWGNASDYAANNFSFGWTTIRAGVFELEVPLKIEWGDVKTNDRRSAILTSLLSNKF
jgi:hypothetical protein